MDIAELREQDNGEVRRNETRTLEHFQNPFHCLG